MPKNQQQSASQTQNQQERFYRVWADIGEIILEILTGNAFRRFAGRLSTLLSGAWIPSTGTADIAVIAALMDKAPSTVEKMAKRIRAPIFRPGDTNLFRFDDFAVRLQSTENPSESSTGVAPSKPES